MWWYHFEVTPDRHAWAYSKSNPQREIAALELFGLTYLMESLAASEVIRPGLHTLNISMDNQGDVYVGNKAAARSWASAAITAHLGESSSRTGLHPLLRHRHRDMNTWADDLSKGKVDLFDPEKRLLPPGDQAWDHMLDLIRSPDSTHAGADLQTGSGVQRSRTPNKRRKAGPPPQTTNASRDPTTPPPIRRRSRLRARETPRGAPPAGKAGSPPPAGGVPEGPDPPKSYPFDEASLRRVVRKAEMARWPDSKRPWVLGTSICLGLATARDGGPMVNPGNLICQGFTEMVNGALTKSLYKLETKFHWSSLQINMNTVAEWHQDSGNTGPSAMVVGGSFSGGEFQIDGHAPTQLAGRIIFFDGHNWHRSLPFKGTRLSIVAFSHSLLPSCTPRLRSELEQLGFVLG